MIQNALNSPINGLAHARALRGEIDEWNVVNYVLVHHCPQNTS
jgi:hypothetical protein